MDDILPIVGEVMKAALYGMLVVVYFSLIILLMLRTPKEHDRKTAHSLYIPPPWRPEPFSWALTGKIVHFGPTVARYFGDAPRDVYTQETPAELALVDDQLVLKTGDDRDATLHIALSSIFWIGVQPIEVMAMQAPIYQTAVFAYMIVEVKRSLLAEVPEPGSGWHLRVFGLIALEEFAEALSRVSDLTLDTAHADRRLDCGPSRVRVMRENIYGQWSKAGEDLLYLAPDRLLVGQTSIFLSQIRGLGVIHRAGLKLGRSALMRVEYAGPEGKPQTIGFVLSPGLAETWADAIQRRVDVPLDSYLAQRKRKVAS